MFQLPDKVPSLQCFDFQLLLGRPMPPQPPVLSQFEPMSKKIETLGKQSENKSLQNWDVINRIWDEEVSLKILFT